MTDPSRQDWTDDDALKKSHGSPSYPLGLSSNAHSNAASSYESSEHKVTHNYHDHSNDANGGYEFQPATGTEQSFPMRLHYMLNDIQQDNLSHIVSWMPHGRCFVVHNQKLFVDKILGCWFRQSKFASFQRQLNIYGFQRLTAGPDKNGYYHELFLRGRPGLAARIQRHKLKGTKTRRAASPESEPNFYAMSFMPSNARASPPKPASAWDPTLVRASLQGNSGSSGLTLQKIVPTILSPVTFETTVHLVPQQHSRQQGLMVKSTCSVTLKPNDDTGASNIQSAGRFPLAPTAFTFQGSIQRSLAYSFADPLLSRNNEALWAALRDGTMPIAFPKPDDTR